MSAILSNFAEKFRVNQPIRDMQYTKVTFSYSFEETFLEDILLQGLGDLGFETFDGKEAYIQTALFSQEALNSFLFDFNAQYSTIASAVKVEEVPDQNWNAGWEAEHPMEELPDGVKIVPHCAFGAGHHETTGMMINMLMKRFSNCGLAGKAVLDMGCGTGVLGIYAARYGAQVTAVDIDDKSVANTVENAELNHVQLATICSGNVPCQRFDLILANIHRNILLSQMEDYSACLQPGGEVWLSGFYETDIPLLIEKAESCGLHHIGSDHRGEWRMLTLQKS